jgi:2-polyprenyl-3-methyl-5-hydroxy-6-metoxy-1,4-benzoquinol methylase
VTAGSAWALARDPRAAAIIAELLDRLGALERQAVQQLAPDLVDPLPPYFLHARPEILERIPLSASNLLELGCAAGILGQTVKARQQCRYVGVELDPSVARIAANSLDQVVVLDLDTSELPFEAGTFDCVICADVLEHLKDPWAVLAQVFSLLQPGGHVVVSIPNIRNLGVMAALAAGDWAYQDAGILDRTHLRFFTLRTFAQALAGSGFEIGAVNSVTDPSLQAAISGWGTSGSGTSASGQVLQAKLGQLQIDGLSPQDSIELATVQFLMVGTRPLSPSGAAK